MDDFTGTLDSDSELQDQTRVDSEDDIDTLDPEFALDFGNDENLETLWGKEANANGGTEATLVKLAVLLPKSMP